MRFLLALALFLTSPFAFAEVGTTVSVPSDFRSPVTGSNAEVIRYLYEVKAPHSECGLNRDSIRLMIQRDVNKEQYLSKFLTPDDKTFMTVIQEGNVSFIGDEQSMEPVITLAWGSRCLNAPLDMQILADWLSGSSVYNDVKETASYTYYDKEKLWKKSMAKGPWTISYGVWMNDSFSGKGAEVMLQSPSTMTISYLGTPVLDMKLLDVQAFSLTDPPADYKPFALR